MDDYLEALAALQIALEGHDRWSISVAGTSSIEGEPFRCNEWRAQFG
jgi:hypothetical protein